LNFNLFFGVAMEKTRILVVDDEQLIRWSIEQNLKKQGYDVTIAENGEVALRLVSEEQPDLILLEIQMPGISGLEVLERVKETDEDIVVSWLPPRGGLETAVNAMRLGAYDYISKPFNFDEMSIVIRRPWKHHSCAVKWRGCAASIKRSGSRTLSGRANI
jgi:DNA-binding NtrC family response regulator